MGRVFAVADLHGMLELYQKIKDFLEPEDKVFYLGDMGDRGTDCWETVKTIMNDPQFECLKGNHEDMLIKAMEAWFHYPEEEKELAFYNHDVSILSYNGGSDTLLGWTKESAQDRSTWYRRIKELPTFLKYKNTNEKWIYMSHAGWTPLTYDDIPVDEDLIWDRSHYMYGWPHDAPEDIIVVHGHTPIPYLVDDRHIFYRGTYEIPELPCAYWYSDNHKCCIDNGAFYMLCTVLLNLDTFEVHNFYTDDYDPEAKWD